MNVRRLISWQPLAPIPFFAAAALALYVVFFAVLSIVRHNAHQAAETKVEGAMSGARAKAGTDAGRIVDDAHAAQTASEDLTRKNADEIRKAPGADAPIDPRLNDAGRRGLCNRPAYRGRPECAVQ